MLRVEAVGGSDEEPLIRAVQDPLPACSVRCYWGSVGVTVSNRVEDQADRLHTLPPSVELRDLVAQIGDRLVDHLLSSRCEVEHLHRNPAGEQAVFGDLQYRLEVVAA